MSGVNLNDTEARFASTTCGRGKCRNDVPNTIDGERSGHWIVGEGQCTRGNDIVPASFSFRDPSVTCPRAVGARLATGVRQLQSSHAALLMNKPDDSSEWLDVLVHPDAQVLRADSALRKDCSGFRKHQSSPAYRAAAQMHEMPVVSVSVSAGVLAHWRNKYAIHKPNVPNRERIKQVSH